MRQFKGYSLIELLVTMFIMLMVISAVYLTYTSLLKGYKREGGIGGNIVSEQSALELIRRDIVLAGLGISADVTPLLMSGIDDNVTITFRTTQNPSSDKSFGYLVLRFDNNTNSWVVLADKRIDNTVNRIIVIDSTRKRWTLDNLTASKIPQSSPYPPDNYIAFGYPVVTGDYETIDYQLGGTIPSRCNPSTKNLLRNNLPIFNCVKGFKVYFGADTDNNGTVDSYYDNLSVTAFDNVTKIYNNLHTITFYILTHDGGIDRNFNYGSNTVVYSDNEVGLNISFSLNGVTDYNNYRWKIIKVSSKAINIRGVELSD